MQTFSTTPNASPVARRSRANAILLTLLALAIGLMLIAGGIAIAAGGDMSTEAAVLAMADETATIDTTVAVETAADTDTAVLALADIGTELVDASAVGEAVIPSVVTIQISDTWRNTEMVVGSGSGVIYDGNGNIVTNAHVVEAGETYEVVLWDGRVYPAELVGYDSTTDLAVLHTDAVDLTPIELGSTTDLQAGDPAIAVGSPLGLDGGPSLTVGVISALGRTVDIDTTTSLFGMLQADAPITQGSSGGALVDDDGNLLGVTSAVGVSEVGVEGIGFSTPVEIVARVVDEIISAGEATQPYLGIAGTTGFTATEDGGEQPIGVEVVEVEMGSPADVAGIEVGDVITSLNGTAVDTMAELVADLRTYSSGDTVEVTLDGAGTTGTVSMVVGDR